jgi:hypothetical protein
LSIVSPEALINLAPHLPDELKTQACHEALATTRIIGDESPRAKTLIGLSLHLSDKLQVEALATVHATGDVYDRAKAMSTTPSSPSARSS